MLMASELGPLLIFYLIQLILKMFIPM